MKDVVNSKGYNSSDNEIDKYDYVESECPDYYYSLFFPNPSMEVASSYHKECDPNNTMLSAKNKRTYEDCKPAAKKQVDNTKDDCRNNKVKIIEGKHPDYYNNLMLQNQQQQPAAAAAAVAEKQNTSFCDNSSMLSAAKKKKQRTTKDDSRKDVIDTQDESNDFIEADFHEYYMDVFHQQFH